MEFQWEIYGIPSVLGGIYGKIPFGSRSRRTGEVFPPQNPPWGGFFPWNSAEFIPGKATNPMPWEFRGRITDPGRWILSIPRSLGGGNPGKNPCPGSQLPIREGLELIPWERDADSGMENCCVWEYLIPGLFIHIPDGFLSPGYLIPVFFILGIFDFRDIRSPIFYFRDI